MPKNQSTAAHRARQAAREGAKYTEALRGEQAQSNPYADPTFASLRTAVLELDASLAAAKTRIVDDRATEFVDPVHRSIDQAREMLVKLADKLQGPPEGITPGEVRKWLDNAEHPITYAHRMTYGAESFRLAADQASLHTLKRMTRAIFTHRCTEGIKSSSPCSLEPGRVLVRAHDAFGASDGDQACVRHAAEHIALRDPKATECQILGDHRTAARARALARKLAAEGWTPYRG